MSRSRLILLGGLVVLLASAAVSASASALQYYIKGGELIKGTLLVDGSGGVQIFKGKAAGAAITITCSNSDTHGTGTNTTSPTSIVESTLFLGCVISGASFAGCLVPEMMITVNLMGVLIGTTAAPGIEFLPPSGTTLLELQLEKCTREELDKKFPVEGSLLGKVNNTDSSVSIKEEGEGSMLKFGGNSASFSGEGKVEMTGGGLLEVK